jgi:hypothetical protein
MGVAGSPVQVRNDDAAGIEVENGRFLSSALPVAGFAIIGAATVEEAVQLVSATRARWRGAWSRSGRCATCRSRQSQPPSSATRTASAWLRVAVFAIAADR